VASSQAGQAFRLRPETLQKLLGIRKDKLLENTARRILYQEKIFKHSVDPNIKQCGLIRAEVREHETREHRIEDAVAKRKPRNQPGNYQALPLGDS
jgi:hypothetical protein